MRYGGERRESPRILFSEAIAVFDEKWQGKTKRFENLFLRFHCDNKPVVISDMGLRGKIKILFEIFLSTEKQRKSPRLDSKRKRQSS